MILDGNHAAEDGSQLPEQKAREKIDKQLRKAGWDIVDRDEYIPDLSLAVREGLMAGNTESDYLLFIDNKAIAVVEAKREENELGIEVEQQAEWYCAHPQSWYGLWFKEFIPLVYLANGKKILFKNLMQPDSDYVELSEMHSPKKMLQLIGETSEFGALPRIEKKGLRECQYNAEVALENSLRSGQKKSLAVLATGSGKTYLACLASYRLLNYTDTKRILFLVDRNNLARQTESEFSLFDRTEKGQPMSNLYQIKRLRHEEDAKADICIATIQKLFAVLTGQTLSDGNEDAEDEQSTEDEEKKADDTVVLDGELKLNPDHFQFIIVDECHRSIYGKWRAVLEYFTDAKILGLTATPTPEAYSFFNNNIIEKYTYDDSVVDGVNVPARVYRISTQVTEHGGEIKKGKTFYETTKARGNTASHIAGQTLEYDAETLDRSIVNVDQIRTVLRAYKNAIYNDLYPNREAKWEYIPKTLIFAKNDNHASTIVDVAREVFADEFDGNVPDHFVQKITYSAEDSNALIRALRTEKDFRIAVTVTLVATGTDVKPLEIVMFMKDVQSDVLYTQMKGRGCRTISDDKLKEVTPNSDGKECFYIVDAVGVTEHEKFIPTPGLDGKKRVLSLEQLMEHLSHNEVSDDNLVLLRDYCSTIHNRYENNPLFGRHLEEFMDAFCYSPRDIAEKINDAIAAESLPEYLGPSHNNSVRMSLIQPFITTIAARRKLLELYKGYVVTTDDEDTVLYSGFSKESAKTYIENFEKYINDNKDSIEALRIIYNSEDVQITHSMLLELRDKLLLQDRQFGVNQIWKNYKLLDTTGSVDELDVKENAGVLTNFIEIVSYAYKKVPKLTNIIKGYSQRLSLYYGQNQRTLTSEQMEVMKQIADYVIRDGAITVGELNEVNTDLWRQGVGQFGVPALKEEMKSLAKFILKVA